MKVYKIILVFLIINLLIYFDAGFRFTKKAAIEFKADTDVQILSTYKYNNSEIATFKYQDQNTLGIADLWRGFGRILWRCNYQHSPEVQDGEPFLFNGGCREKEYFFIVYTEDPQIKYIALGGNKKNYEDQGIIPDLKFVSEHTDVFMLREIKDNHGVFYGKNDKNYRLKDMVYVRAFGGNGELIAVEYYGDDAHYIK